MAVSLGLPVTPKIVFGGTSLNKLWSERWDQASFNHGWLCGLTAMPAEPYAVCPTLRFHFG